MSDPQKRNSGARLQAVPPIGGQTRGMDIRRISDFVWEIPRQGGMLVPGRIFASDALMESVLEDRATDQVANVAHLPGIVDSSLAMPDIHWGYGFPIGGVAATTVDDGVVSPGGVGFDICCGVRLIASRFTEADFNARRDDIMSQLDRRIPRGIGKGAIAPGALVPDVLRTGAAAAPEGGHGWGGALDRVAGSWFDGLTMSDCLSPLTLSLSKGDSATRSRS